jgi:hypothetical protein
LLLCEADSYIENHNRVPSNNSDFHDGGDKEDNECSEDNDEHVGNCKEDEQLKPVSGSGWS